jgi:NAD-dependent SIR2 family protein deacetylase
MREGAFVHQNELITRSVGYLRAADGLVITAGAGMGVDSGLPDFRGTEGFWRAYPALASASISFEEIASPAAFAEWPALAWGFYGHRLQLYRDTTPHEGFTILRKWSESFARGAFVFTSNVDGHFQKAGFSPERIVECHGSINHVQCLDDCRGSVWAAEEIKPEVDTATGYLKSALPRCPHCGGLARPNILMFGDSSWVSRYADAQMDRLDAWLRTVERPVVIELGAGKAIPSVRNFGSRLKAPLIRINARDFSVGRENQVGFEGTALATLRAIDEALNRS